MLSCRKRSLQLKRTDFLTIQPIRQKPRICLLGSESSSLSLRIEKKNQKRQQQKMPHGTLEVVLVSAKGLEDTDFLNSMDPYVLLTCRTQDQKSNVASGQGTTPEWNETFIFSVSEGTTELKAKIFDKDVGTEDDAVGEANIPLEPVFLEGDIPPTAYNVVKDGEFKGEIWIALSFKPSENRSRGFEEESYGGWKNSEASY